MKEINKMDKAQLLLPDVRDGLNQLERTILFCLHELQKELGKEYVPSVMLYGRVAEHIDINPEQLQIVMQKLTGLP